MTEASADPSPDKMEAPPSPSSPIQSNRRASWARVRALFTADRITAAFTVVLALATLALVITSYFQHIDAVEAIEATKRLAIATENAANAAQSSAHAADATNKLNANVLRPWIPPNITVGRVHYDVNGTNIEIGVILQNIGKTPALHVWPEAFAYTGSISGGGSLAEQKTKCDEARNRPVSAKEIGFSIFPDRNTPVNLTLTISKAEIEALDRQYGDRVRYSPVLIIGCINYQFAGGVERHQSGFIYWLQRRQGIGIGVIHNDEDISGYQLWLQEWFLDAGAFYAD